MTVIYIEGVTILTPSLILREKGNVPAFSLKLGANLRFIAPVVPTNEA